METEHSVIVVGAGEALGDSIYEAKLFVRGSVKSLGADCVEKEMRPEHLEKLAELLASAKGPVLLSCGSSNRCGALLALKAYFVDGKSKDQALAFGRSGGLKALEPTVTARLAK